MKNMIQSKTFKGELGKATQRNFLNCKIESTKTPQYRRNDQISEFFRKD